VDAYRSANRARVGFVCLFIFTAAGCRTQAPQQSDGNMTSRSIASAEWPELFRRGDSTAAQVASAALPLPIDCDPDILEALEQGAMTTDGRVIQAQPVAWDGPEGNARRMIVRWLCNEAPQQVVTDIAYPAPGNKNAGWSFDYRWVEGGKESLPWIPVLRNVPLEKTEYEMYQLDLRHKDQQLGVRLGLRHNDRIYWWQFIRADFVQRGPVFDLLRCGGPIYNEESTIQGDLFLVLYANGLIEAYAHFINNQREGIGTETHGVPVIAFDVPGRPEVDTALDGTKNVLPMGGWQLNLGQSVGFADEARPGSLKTEGDVVVLQPWMDQEVYGELLVEREGIRESQIVPGTSRGGEDAFWVAKLGERTIPKGMARSVRFTMSPADVPPEVAGYQAPAWWHAKCHALPTSGKLPVMWWAVPRALEVGEEYFTPHPRHGPFELGCSGRDQDGTLGAAMLLLGNASEHPRYCEHAPLPAYWWADIATDHVDFTVHELPKYSWQWIVQPYQRWTELVYAYWQNGDPYLVETARFAADAYYRFFWTNRPHRSVGRDALPCSGLLALYECTGEEVYLRRVREILAEARRSHAQQEHYWPGHQSGAGPNGVGRQPSYGYISMVMARLHVQLIEAAQGTLPPEEEEDAWAFIRAMHETFSAKGRDDGWVMRAISLSYLPLTALADHHPDEAAAWIDRLREWNAFKELPDTHDGGKPYSWVVSALRFDSWAWGATWEDGTLHLQPHVGLLKDTRAPKTATILTPDGPVTVTYHEDGTVSADQVGVVIHGR
jgi:hypothetical protein